MNWTINKLSIIVGVLSVIVLYESVYILTSLMNREKRLTAVPEVPKEVIERMNASAEEEAMQFKEEFLDEENKSSFELVQIVCEDCAQQMLEVYLIAGARIKSAHVKLLVPEGVEFVDQIEAVDGVQVMYGDADVYLKNLVQNGIVELDALFEEGFEGRIKLGQLIYLNQTGEPVDFNFDFQRGLLSGSYVTAFDSGKNILTKPETYTF